MIKYYCQKCNYRFQSSSSEKPTLCPYCGEKGVVEKEESAEHLCSQ